MSYNKTVFIHLLNVTKTGNEEAFGNKGLFETSGGAVPLMQEGMQLLSRFKRTQEQG